MNLYIVNISIYLKYSLYNDIWTEYIQYENGSSYGTSYDHLALDNYPTICFSPLYRTIDIGSILNDESNTNNDKDKAFVKGKCLYLTIIELI